MAYNILFQFFHCKATLWGRPGWGYMIGPRSSDKLLWQNMERLIIGSPRSLFNALITTQYWYFWLRGLYYHTNKSWSGNPGLKSLTYPKGSGDLVQNDQNISWIHVWMLILMHVTHKQICLKGSRDKNGYQHFLDQQSQELELPFGLCFSCFNMLVAKSGKGKSSKKHAIEENFAGF